MSISKKFFSYLFIFFSLGLIINLSKDIWRLIQAGKRIDQAKQKLSQLQQENQQLREKYQYQQKDSFVEAEIRDKLQMAKPGETVIILPEKLSQALKGQPEKVSLREKNQQLANWQKWLRLFL